METGRYVLAGQESRDCFDSISDVGIHGIYLSPALGTAKFKQLDLSSSFKNISIYNILCSDNSLCHFVAPFFGGKAKKIPKYPQGVV